MFDVKEVIPFEMNDELIEVRITLEDPIPYKLQTTGQMKATDELRIYTYENDVQNVGIDVWDYSGEENGEFIDLIDDIELLGWAKRDLNEIRNGCRNAMIQTVMQQVRKLNIQGGM